MPYQPVNLTELAPTEQVNPHTQEIDLLDTEAMLTLMNQEDQQVALAVQRTIPQIALVVDKVVQAFQQGGRLFYVGAGTSGRLGVLDASECPPTFGVGPELVQGIIAGGDTALRNAVEGAEDSSESGQEAINSKNISSNDIVIGISASGGANYVVSAVQTAKQKGVFTAAITCHPHGALAQAVDVAMVAEVGPEVIAGSSRMKAGTAQKLILNMITTGAMIAWGKTYRNYMVDLKPTNLKLQQRSQRIVATLAQCSLEEAESALVRCNAQVKPAIVAQIFGVSLEAAQAMLNKHHGKLRAVLQEELPS